MTTLLALNSRLRNCLTTILELEETLEHTPLAESLHDEFSVLKDVLQRLSTVVVEEQDVHRIEAATARFLDELKGTLGAGKLQRPASSRFLQ